MIRRNSFCLAIALVVLTLGLAPGNLSAGAEPAPLVALRRLVDGVLNDRSALVVLDATSGRTLLDYHGDESLKPASVLKILTTAVALHELGPEYQFQTELWRTKGRKNGAPDLIVRGGGDPDLTTEAVYLMARRVRTQGILEVGDIIVDQSRFVGEHPNQGQRAYEAGASALAFNFNSIAINVCPASSGEEALVTADPWEPGVRFTGRVKTTGKSGGDVAVDLLGAPFDQIAFQVSGTIGAGHDCITAYRSLPDTTQYFGETFRSILGSLGIKVQGTIREGQVPPGAELLFSQGSKPLSLILEDLNHFSNNFIAEQILFALGTSGETMSRERGLTKLAAFAAKYPGGEEVTRLSDGSGLSHGNRISAALLAEILADMRQDREFGIEFIHSLSVSSRNGTLKRRDFDEREAFLRGKTGTLDGVSSLAGYLFDRGGHELAFVIIQNGAASKDRAVAIEERIVSALARLE